MKDARGEGTHCCRSATEKVGDRLPTVHCCLAAQLVVDLYQEPLAIEDSRHHLVGALHDPWVHGVVADGIFQCLPDQAFRIALQPAAELAEDV
ncbi:hypothetical protein D9M71_684770 [compost metagenome]